MCSTVCLATEVNTNHNREARTNKIHRATHTHMQTLNSGVPYMQRHTCCVLAHKNGVRKMHS